MASDNNDLTNNGKLAVLMQRRNIAFACGDEQAGLAPLSFKEGHPY